MRLWTLHPKYLDARGLVALWREALLAQAVLAGRTSGYTQHPQLIRFRNSPSPLGSIAFYIQTIHTEATRRGYGFDITKIPPFGNVEPILVTSGQLEYEWKHLSKKLQVRSPSWWLNFKTLSHPEPHPIFRIVPGLVEKWEILASSKI